MEGLQDFNFQTLHHLELTPKFYETNLDVKMSLENYNVIMEVFYYFDLSFIPSSFHYNLMKLEGSQGNIPKKFNKLVMKT
jgi:hypothetical protein